MVFIIASGTIALLIGFCVGMYLGHNIGWHARDWQVAILRNKNAEQSCALRVTQLDRQIQRGK